jgi:hypothetical protein
MAQMPVVCTTCSAPVNAVFDPTSGSRSSITLSSHLTVTDRCFVHDTIVFHQGGGIIFAPAGEKKTYHDSYSVICRRLVVIGGGQPPRGNPCGADDPGSTYKNLNVITWAGRLRAAPDGANYASSAPDGGNGPGETQFDPDEWADQGQGNNGRKGQRGHDGQKGAAGGSGMNTLGFSANQMKEIRPVLNIVALEVEFDTAGSHLIIDWDGQAAGSGGRGQNGGRGGAGMGGRDGSTDDSVWGDSCERGPGNGGDAGDGGNGGAGGDGGIGGAAGDIHVISVAANLVPGGPLFGSQVSYVNGGGQGGDPGEGGRGGKGGTQFGRAGKKSSACEEAQNGESGFDGSPEPGTTGGTTPGTAGMPGAAGPPPFFEPIDPPRTRTCADLIPPALTIAGIAPATGARNTTVPVVITGVGFDSAAPQQVTVSGAGITVGPLTVTPTTIQCDFVIGQLAPQNARDVTVTVGLTTSVTSTGGFTVV